tara:strand:- start:677 stop:1645 length:969 start_codon:yes stop_codon:yes gene_type:complete
MTKLDEQLEAGLCGDFVTGQRIADELEVETPKCPAGAFNRGWYELRKGNLQKGHTLLDCGRHINVFGNRHIGSTRPIWNGETGATVLLNLEGGLGDQINGVRFAKNLSEYGNKVIVSGSSSLAETLVDCEGVSAFVQNEACLGVYHDYWLPSMSAVVPLKLEYKDLSGKPYIKRLSKSEGKVGIRWSGNPEFEHQQHRLFDKKLMFDAVNNADCISLQKDEVSPDWMEQPSLDTWENTRKQVSRCDLVITSCTSIAHLAGAMGIETWIVVPILPYYLWALPGSVTPHYSSVTLFRQEKYGQWEELFIKIKSMLDNLAERKVA